jgi:hypothetical protein
MRIDYRFPCAALVLLGLTSLVAMRPAQADVAIAGGAFVTRDATSGAATFSLGAFNAPVVPLSAELTAAAAGGGYAATLDGRLALGGTTIGAGAGVGSLGDTTTTSVLYDALADQRIFPHTALEARLYVGPHRPSSLFAGIRFSF